VETTGNSRAYAHPPFTNEEVFRAGAIFMSPEMLEEAKAIFPGSPDDPFMGHVTTRILLILCALSGELADRVTASYPNLKTEAQRVRSDPETFVQSIRNEVLGRGSGDTQSQDRE